MRDAPNCLAETQVPAQETLPPASLLRERPQVGAAPPSSPGPADLAPGPEDLAPGPADLAPGPAPVRAFPSGLRWWPLLSRTLHPSDCPWLGLEKSFSQKGARERGGSGCQAAGQEGNAVFSSGGPARHCAAQARRSGSGREFPSRSSPHWSACGATGGGQRPSAPRVAGRQQELLGRRRRAVPPASCSCGCWPAGVLPPLRCSQGLFCVLLTASPLKKKSAENGTLACQYLGILGLQLTFPFRAYPPCSTSEASGHRHDLIYRPGQRWDIEFLDLLCR